MPVTVIEGDQRGDEGKGRFVDMLMEDFDIGARFNGGDNAGHTVVTPEGEEFDVHGLPTSALHEGAMSVIGNGTVINPLNLTGEIDDLVSRGVDIGEHNLLISGSAHLILPHHILEDRQREEGKDAQGTTKSGIAPAYRDKAARVGVRAEIIKNDPDKLYEVVYAGYMRVQGVSESGEAKEVATEYVAAAKRLGEFVTDTALYLNRELAIGKKVMAEGAQAYLLDNDHGMYPFVTSSITTVGGAIVGLGIAPQYIDRVIGISKATQSHVGGGPFVTEIYDEKMLERLRGQPTDVDGEYGTTTKRPRRLGYLDLPQIKRSQIINGTTEMALTKLDLVPRYLDELKVCIAYERKGKRLDIAPDAAYKLEQCTPIYQPLANWDDDIHGVRHFDDLPDEARQYVTFIEKITGRLIPMIGVGPGRDQVIVRP